MSGASSAGATQSIGEAMRLEQEHLAPLAKEGFDLARVCFSAGERERQREGVDQLLLGAGGGG